MRLQADMMGAISGLPVARKMRSSSCLAERPRFGRHRRQDHPVLVVASATVRFVAVAILEVRLPSVPAGSFNSHDARWAASSIFYRISARSMAQQTVSGPRSAHRTAGADVHCVRHRSRMICSIVRSLRMGSFVVCVGARWLNGDGTRRATRGSCDRSTTLMRDPSQTFRGGHSGYVSG
jgi:hypothetical protein